MTGAERILSPAQAAAQREVLRRDGKKLVITNGCFDLMHRGHAEYLEAAATHGDALWVLVNSDASVRALKGPSRPLVDEFSRARLLVALRAVERAVIFDSPRCDELLARLRPDVYVKGGDYTVETLNPDERRALDECGCRIVFQPFVDGFSTSNLIRRIREA